MHTTENPTPTPRPLCVSASPCPIPQPAKAPQTTPRKRRAQNEPTAPQKTTPRHNSTSFVRNKATCQNDSRPQAPATERYNLLQLSIRIATLTRTPHPFLRTRCTNLHENARFSRNTFAQIHSHSRAGLP
jgi:hypothetical protein